MEGLVSGSELPLLPGRRGTDDGLREARQSDDEYSQDMDVDEDDDFYAPAEDASNVDLKDAPTSSNIETRPEVGDEYADDAEEDDEDNDDDSDIEIVTERKDGTKAAPPSQARYNEIRNIPQRTGSSDISVKPAIKKESTPKGSLPISGADLPAIATSKIDVDAKPIYEPAGKPITQVVIDDDLTENDKPWRRPGTDVSDYFNYGFDEFTWALYAAKQEALRSEFDPEKISQNQKKMMEDMNMMMTMGGFSGMPGMPTASGAPGASMPGMPAMPGMDGMLPDFQAMMQQMMASGVDMSQMDPATFASMAGGQDGMGGQGGAQGASGAAGFGGQQGYGQAGNQQGMGFGYDNSSNRGRGRGRGHRNW